MVVDNYEYFDWFFITEVGCAYCAVQAEYFYVVQI
jgi:hypothetical protein